MRIHFEIPGPPKGKGRPRFSTRHGKWRTFTPAATMQYEDKVIIIFRKVAPGHIPFNGPVSITITATFPIPTSKPKWWKDRARRGLEPASTCPDLDNILKIICDALNGVAWGDDRQVWSASITKVYGERSCVAVTIESASRAAGKEDHDGKNA